MKKSVFRKFAFTALIAGFVMVSCGKDDDGNDLNVRDNELAGSISGHLELDPELEYYLTGPLIVEEGGVLDIPAGTVIKARQGFSKYILVLQGGKIYARGTADAPVRMIADIEDAGQGYWGGLIFNGGAPLAGTDEVGSTEVNSSYTYGGNDAGESSGELTYLVLGNTGARSSADVEHNGLTLNGVGSGTVIENIYIYDSADDGIEFFGGSVNVTNLLVVNSDDDMFDFTQGYSGTLKNAYGIWESGFSSSESDPRGIEADGNLDGNFPTHVNQSDFRIENITFDLRLDHASGDPARQMQDLIKVRRGAKAVIVNALVKGSGAVGDLIDLTDGKGNGDLGSQISLTNMLDNAIDGSEIKPADAEAIVIESGNIGCDSKLFSWTGYEF